MKYDLPLFSWLQDITMENVGRASRGWTPHDHKHQSFLLTSWVYNTAMVFVTSRLNIVLWDRVGALYRERRTTGLIVKGRRVCSSLERRLVIWQSLWRRCSCVGQRDAEFAAVWSDDWWLRDTDSVALIRGCRVCSSLERRLVIWQSLWRRCSCVGQRDAEFAAVWSDAWWSRDTALG